MTPSKSQFEVVRSITVAAKPEVVQWLVADFHQWERWSPWADLDPDMALTFSGPDAGVGAIYEWKGNRKAGEGRMEIIEDVSNERVVIALDFIKPFRSSNTTTFEFVRQGNDTLVTWRMVGPKTLMTKIMGIFKSMDAMIGPDFEKGLARLAAAATSR